MDVGDPSYFQSPVTLTCLPVADLAAYNTTVTFSNDLNIVQPSEFADNFWLTYVPCMSSPLKQIHQFLRRHSDSAVIAVDVNLVTKFSMPESAVSPTNPNEMLYQIDGFHELHCLVGPLSSSPCLTRN
jgi:hypothetical protein